MNLFNQYQQLKKEQASEIAAIRKACFKLMMAEKAIKTPKLKLVKN